MALKTPLSPAANCVRRKRKLELENGFMTDLRKLWSRIASRRAHLLAQLNLNWLVRSKKSVPVTSPRMAFAGRSICQVMSIELLAHVIWFLLVGG